MLQAFLNATYPTQLVLLLAMAVCAWYAVWTKESVTEEYRKAHLSRVNFFLVLFTGSIFLAILYSLATSERPWLIGICIFFTWSLTALAAISAIRGHIVLRVISAIIVVSTLLLLPKYHFHLDRMVKDLDRLIGNGHEAEFFEGAYVSLTVYVVLFYYGEIYRLRHLRHIANRSAAMLDASVISNLVTISAGAMAFLIGLYFGGVSLPSLTIFSGLVGAGITISVRDFVQSSVAGMQLIWDRAIKKGDVITINGEQYGWVESITPRYTVIKDRNEINTLIPNSVLLTSPVRNWTQNNNKVRLKLDIGVPYETDVHDVIDRLIHATRRVSRVLQDPKPNALVMGMGDSAINLQVRFWIDDPKEGIRNVISLVYLEILDEFAHGNPKITIPFPQREIRILPPAED